MLTYIGTGMLWVGWYGFNSGSAVAADVIAANAFTTTTIATAVASFVWPMWEWLVKGKPSVLGFCSGAVAGLVVITPACGYVTPQGSIWIGIAAGTICWFMCYKVKGWFGYDDALDTFGVHAIGGTVGAIMTGMLAVSEYGGTSGAIEGNWGQVLNQCIGVGIVFAYDVVVTLIILKVIDLAIGLRVSQEVERDGLDLALHGETIQ